MTAMDVHFLIYSCYPSRSGGRENWIYHVTRALAAAGHRVTIYGYGWRGRAFYPVADIPGVRFVKVFCLQGLHPRVEWISRAVKRIPLFLDMPLFWTCAFFSLLFRVRARGTGGSPVIVAMNAGIESSIGEAVRFFRRRIRVAASVRGKVAYELAQWMPFLSRFFYWAERWTLLRADRVLVNGFDTQQYLADMGIPSLVVPNGVDLARFRHPTSDDDPDVRRLRDLRERGTPVVISIATLREIKHVRLLIEAAALLKRGGRTPPPAVVFVGRGEQEPYREFARAQGVGNEVLFLGEKSNVAAFLACADIATALSGGSGMSMSALEALAAGKPVVAWDTDTYRQIIRHGETGWLVPEADAQALSEALDYLLDNPEAAAELGRRAEAAMEAFDWPHVAQRLVEAILGSPKARRFPEEDGPESRGEGAEAA